MRTTEQDRILEERLQNWGRSLMMFKSRHASPLYWLRIEAEKAQGKGFGMDSLKVIDYEDAVAVNSAWIRLPEIPERYRLAKRFLVVWYSRPDLRLKAIQTRFHIRTRDVDSFREFAKDLIDKELDKQKNAV